MSSTGHPEMMTFPPTPVVLPRSFSSSPNATTTTLGRPVTPVRPRSKAATTSPTGSSSSKKSSTTAMVADPAPGDLHHLGAWLSHLELAGHPATTVATYRSVLRSAARELPHGLCAEPQEIVAWLATHRAANTRAGYATALRAFYRWCLADGRITVDPTAGLPAPRQRRGVPRPVTDAELAALLGRARQPVATWCTLAAYAGLRCVEVARLRPEDITPEVLYVTGKGDKPRAVPTHPLVWAAAAGLPPGPVAGGRTPATVSHRVSAEARRLGLPGVTAHRLRHWCLTQVQRGGDLRVTQEIAGHSSPATTAVYTQVSDAAKRAAVLGLPQPTLSR